MVKKWTDQIEWFKVWPHSSKLEVKTVLFTLLYLIFSQIYISIFWIAGSYINFTKGLDEVCWLSPSSGCQFHIQNWLLFCTIIRNYHGAIIMVHNKKHKINKIINRKLKPLLLCLLLKALLIKHIFD